MTRSVRGPRQYGHTTTPSQTMTDPHRDEPCCLAFVCESASRAQAVLAGAAIERAADAMRHVRGVPPRTKRPPLVARVAALRSADLAAALAAEGVPAPTARALAPDLERALARDALAGLDPNLWVSLHWADDVPVAERGALLRLGTLVIEAAEALVTPRAVSSAVVHLEPIERSPAGPWLGLLAAGAELFGMTEPREVRRLLDDVRDRLVARPGVRTWLPASGATETESTIAVRTPAGRPLSFAPFVVTDRETHAELEVVVLPDAALPAPVRRLPLGQRRR